MWRETGARRGEGSKGKDERKKRQEGKEEKNQRGRKRR